MIEIKKIRALVNKNRLARLFFFVAVATLFLFTAIALLVFYYALQTPDPSILAVRRVNESTKIYDRSGETVLYDVHGEEKRTVVSWENIPQNVKNATIAVEDAAFYGHKGIDLSGILRALYRDIRNLNTAEGGSTITQQLIKLTIVGEEKKLPRKIKEAILAIRLEQTFSKDQILWMYLNQIPYGSNAYGIEAASQTFFKKPAKELALPEAALLAALPRAPSYYSPHGSHREDLFNRKNYVLYRMFELDMISEDEYQKASEEPLNISQEEGQFPAAHFVIMVREYLIERYGEDLVQNGGLNVITTLDKNQQEVAEELVKKYGEINEKRYRAKNAALMSLDPKTGQILSMVGSRDYWNIEREGNFNVALSKIRQPGSSFKPFAYATLFEKGFPDTTVLFDLLTEFNPSCNPIGSQEYGSGRCYHPKNYTGTFSGPVTLRQALARSLNVPSVKTLYLAGIENTVNTTRDMGVTSLDSENYYGLSLVLGGAGISLHDMVSGYGVFANDGVRVPPAFILKITTSDGAVLEEYKKEEERALSSQAARMISDILSDNNARAPAFGFSNNLVVPGRQVAAKTGTTQNNRDGWLIGYTPSLVAGVWTGNNDDSPMTAAGAGVSAAGPMWNEFMTRILKGTPLEYFPKPNPMVSGEPMRNSDYLGPNGEIHSLLYYLNPQDPQFLNWEYSVRAWAEATGQSRPPETPSPEPSPAI